MSYKEREETGLGGIYFCSVLGIKKEIELVGDAVFIDCKFYRKPYAPKPCFGVKGELNRECEVEMQARKKASEIEEQIRNEQRNSLR